MNLNFYKEYRFAISKFISTKSGKEYDFDMEDNDRFYTYMKPHIIKEKVEGLTEVLIDELFVTDPDNTFFNEKTFTLDTKMLVTDKKNFVYAYSVIIKDIRIIDSANRRYKDGEWTVKHCQLQIPYKTAIDVSEVIDEE